MKNKVKNNIKSYINYSIEYLTNAFLYFIFEFKYHNFMYKLFALIKKTLFKTFGY